MNTLEAKRVLETALICAQQPMPLRDMRSLFDDQLNPDTLRSLLDDLVRDWEDRGVELVALATGWRFQSRPEMRQYLDRLHPEKPPRYSRATMETLAIIAYRQPVTRGDIEDIRGVTVSTQIVKQLEDRGWIEAIGYREAPGRPALYATTRQFLDDLGIARIDQLPAIDNTPSAEALQLMAADQPSLLPEGHDGQSPLPLDDDGPTVEPSMAASVAASEQTSEVAVDAQIESAIEPGPEDGVPDSAAEAVLEVNEADVAAGPATELAGVDVPEIAGVDAPELAAADVSEVAGADAPVAVDAPADPVEPVRSDPVAHEKPAGVPVPAEPDDDALPDESTPAAPV